METVAMFPELTPALPEIVLGIGAMILLVAGVFRSSDESGPITWGALVLFAIAAFLVAGQPAGTVTTFGGDFISDSFGRFAKLVVLIGAGATLYMGMSSIRADKLDRFEYPVLAVLATLGMCMMISANGLISLYVGLELQSLALYVVAAFKRDSLRSSEAGLKYFVLGALSSGMLLYGASLIYGFTGTVQFAELAKVLQGEASVGVVVGLVFFMAGMAFKVSAVPFHMWTPDVYEGAPSPITAFLAAAPKVAALAMFVRAGLGAFPGIIDQWQPIVVFLSFASMVLGAFAAIGQTNIKRLMAYSSISHMGYALIGLAVGTPEGVQGILIYLAVYLAMTVAAFACILAMRRPEGPVENIEDLAGLSRSQPLMALLLGIVMMSLAGMPPFAGFIGKFYIFSAAIEAGFYTLAIVGMLSSVVALYYYAYVVKVAYFDEPAAPFEKPMPSDIRVALGVSSIVVTFLIVWPSPLIESAAVAAGSLF